jgi:hypothetical protein
MPAFADWLRTEVSAVDESPFKPSADVLEASRLPEMLATGYRHMYAHGMHFRIKDAEEEKLICDSAIVASVSKRKTGRESLNAGEMETVEYVGWIHEIIELNYRSHCCIVLLCSWVPARMEASNSKVVRDRYGFAMVNLQSPMTLGPNSFAFPTQCQQVFFSDDVLYSGVHGGDWKVVCGTTVRGRRGDLDYERPEMQILNPGRDADWKGLRLVHASVSGNDSAFGE